MPQLRRMSDGSDTTASAEHASAARFGVLVLLALCLVCWLLVAPGSEKLALIGALAWALPIISAAGWAARDRRWHRGAGLGAAVLAVIAGWVAVEVSLTLGRIVASIVLIIVGVIVPVIVVKALRRRGGVDAQMLAGAVSIYLLVGIAFAMAYTIVAVATHEPLFATATGAVDGSFSDRVYFSFITLSTTGYGDFTPVNGVARSLAILEAIGGQLYLVTAVATIVSLLAAKLPGSRSEG